MEKWLKKWREAQERPSLIWHLLANLPLSPPAKFIMVDPGSLLISAKGDARLKYLSMCWRREFEKRHQIQLEMFFHHFSGRIRNCLTHLSEKWSGLSQTSLKLIFLTQIFYIESISVCSLLEQITLAEENWFQKSYLQGPFTKIDNGGYIYISVEAVRPSLLQWGSWCGVCQRQWQWR